MGTVFVLAIQGRRPVGVASPLAALLATVFLSGCGGDQRGELPQTYEVRGVVLRADGEPLTGGNIEFTPKLPSGLKFMGIIAADGKFTAKTVGQGQAAGAPEGVYTAVVVLPTSNQPEDQHLGGFIAIPGEFVVSATAENDFTIRLPATEP